MNTHSAHRPLPISSPGFATGWPEHQPDIMVLSLTTS